MSQLQVNLTPKQTMAFLEADWAKIVVIAGAFGSAKTAAMALWGITKMLQEPHQCLVLRPTYQQLNDAVRPEFEKWLPENSWAKFPSSPPYDCVMKNGGRFMFRHAEHGIVDLKGITAGNILIDQAEELSEETFMFLLGRLRENRGPRKLFLTMNPNGHDWLYRMCRKDAEVIVAPVEEVLDGEKLITRGGIYRKVLEVRLPGGELHRINISLIEITALENPHVDMEFIATQFGLLDEKTRRRFVLLSWEEATGLVFHEFHPDIHVIPDDFKVPAGFFYGGLDHGDNSPTSFHVWNIFWNPRMVNTKDRYFDACRVVGPEYYMGFANVSDHAPEIKRMVDYYMPKAQAFYPIYCDPSIFEKVHQYDEKKFSESDLYQKYGLAGKVALRAARIRKAHPKFTALKQLLAASDNRQHLVSGKPGGPLVYFRESCHNLFAEIEALKLKDITSMIRGVITEDKLVKSPTHAIDDTCYAAMAEVFPPAHQRPSKAPPGTDYKFPGFNAPSLSSSWKTC